MRQLGIDQQDLEALQQVQQQQALRNQEQADRERAEAIANEENKRAAEAENN